MFSAELTAAGQAPEIVFYTRQLHNGGVDRVIFNLGEEFVRRGIASTILVDRHNEHSPFRALIPAGVGYEVLDAEGPVARLVKLRRYLRRTRPRAVMCTSFGFPNLYAVVTRWIAGVRFHLMLTEHCFPSVDARAARRWGARFWFFRLAHLLYPFADSIVAVSRGTAADLTRVIGIRPGRIETIYNPIISEALAAQATDPVDHPWLAAADRPVVIAVGRMEGQKNFGLLIRAFAAVRARRDCRLMILGDGTQRDELEALVRDLGLGADVAMPGFLANPHAYVGRAALLVLSSDFESLANVVVEAMAVGTPVVATDCPSGPAEVLGEGEHGRLVPVGDVEAMRDAILDVLDRRPPAVPAAWLEQFTARRSADLYLERLRA